MRKVYELDIRRLSHLIMKDSAVREPIAAGASRFDAVLGKRKAPAGMPIRQFLLVVDAGAGTTDFALFQAITRIGETLPSYALLRKSVRMCRIAGNEIDMILRAIILRACGVDQQKLSADDFAYATMDLDSQIREIKRNLFDQETIAVELRPTFSGLVDLQSLLADPKMKQDGAELINMRNEILASVFALDQLDALRAASGGGHLQVHVLLTGGSCTLPIIRDLSAGRVDFHGMQMRFVPVDDLPDWIDLLPREAAEQLAAVYPQCAVAIGGSVPTLPLELNDWESPLTPPPPGKRTLPRTQITGV
jgi:molecular chaperone DnaK (HSP70)